MIGAGADHTLVGKMRMRLSSFATFEETDGWKTVQIRAYKTAGAATAATGKNTGDTAGGACKDGGAGGGGATAGQSGGGGAVAGADEVLCVLQIQVCVTPRGRVLCVCVCVCVRLCSPVPG